jgi:hypothetical protein
MNTQGLCFGLVGALSLGMGAAASAQLSAYNQTFEGLDRTSGTALADDGWDLFVTVFNNSDNSVAYTYGVFDAPNDINNPNISVISDATAAPVDQQGLAVFSDYQNGDHGNDRTLEVNVFQEQSIGAGDIGETYRFSVVAAPVLDGNGENVLNGTMSTTMAFIKTLDPNAGFATTNFITADTTALAPGNTPIDLDIQLSDPLLAGQILQFGFVNTATNFEASGVNYDNVSFGLVPEPASLALVGLGGLMLAGRRRPALD